MSLEPIVEDVADHGGSLEAVRRTFPDAPHPWIDLSTGINPHAYPQLELPSTTFTRLPEPGLVVELCRVAAGAYEAPSAANVVAAPGTQILLPRVYSLVKPGRALVLSPTYAEHARCAELAGHQVAGTLRFEDLFDADLAILVNPNNPDGRLIEVNALMKLAAHLTARGGRLVIDEAFMDTLPADHSFAQHIEATGAIVLKSFGKFFGLAGVRLGFAIAPKAVTAKLSAELGPWAVSGTALEYGLTGLADLRWQANTRARLTVDAERLDAMLIANGLDVAGGTTLFRFVRNPQAQAIFQLLARAGIFVRRFDQMPDALRFGLPANDTEFDRLDAALAIWRATV